MRREPRPRHHEQPHRDLTEIRMTDRPEHFLYATGFGIVVRSYDTWEVDIRAADGSIVPRVPVTGPRLPEASTPERPQWVVFGHAMHGQGHAWCQPMPSQLSARRFSRRDFVYYDEVGNYRLTINRAGEFEVRNTRDGRLYQVRILEATNTIDLVTPSSDVTLREVSTGGDGGGDASNQSSVRMRTPSLEVSLVEDASQATVDGEARAANRSALVLQTPSASLALRENAASIDGVAAPSKATARLRTLFADLSLSDEDQSVTVTAGESVTINCQSATVVAAEACAVAAATVDVTATGVVTIKGAQIALNPVP
ncbi:MAG: hypothetical protein ABI624_11035 [Casimicrobiaceae bacterium]